MTKEKIHLRRCLGALRLEVDGSIVEHLTAAIDAMVASVRHENEDLRRTLGPTAIQALLEGKAAVVPSPMALPDSAILATQGCRTMQEEWDAIVSSVRIDALAV